MSKLSKEKVDSISKDAEELFPILEFGQIQNEDTRIWTNNLTRARKEAYVEGATAEAQRAEVLVKALDKISKGDIDDGKLSRDIMFEWNEIATKAIEQYNSKP